MGELLVDEERQIISEPGTTLLSILRMFPSLSIRKAAVYSSRKVNRIGDVPSAQLRGPG